MVRPVQLELPTWGGRRPGAGRKPKPGLRRVSHKRRPPHVPRFPLHVVLRARPDAPGLRRRQVFSSVRAALEAGAARSGFRLVHFSVQGNHLHLVVEAVDKVALSRGMQGLAVRVARAVNRAADRKGGVFADHYFARELKTPAEVRRAVRYVLDNRMLHRHLGPRTDACASAGPLVQPRTWLLTVGWLKSRAGPLPVSAWTAGSRSSREPGPGSPARTGSVLTLLSPECERRFAHAAARCAQLPGGEVVPIRSKRR